VDGSRVKTPMALLTAVATYTLSPSALIAIPSGAASARPVVQPSVGALTRQPVASAGWSSAPLEASRPNTATALPKNAPTYTFRPSGLTVTTAAPSSARPVAQPEVAVAAMQPFPPRGWVRAPVDRLRRNTVTESLMTDVA